MRRTAASLFDIRHDERHEAPPAPWEDDSFFDVDTQWELEQRNHVYFEEYDRQPPVRDVLPKPTVHSVKLNLRRADLAGAEATLTEHEWTLLRWAFRHSCAYCENEEARLVLEHVVPICRGGGTTMSNVVPACALCNGSKGKKDVNAWLGMGASGFWARHAEAHYRIENEQRRKASR